MKRLLVCILIFVCFATVQLFAASGSANHDVAVNIAEIAAVGLSDAAVMTLITNDPVTPGDVPQGSSDNTRYLRYTTLNNAGDTRHIQVSISAAAPAGTALQLTMVGGLGVSSGPVTVTTVDQDVVTAIGSGNTGITPTSGSNLQWSLAIENSALLEVGAYACVATFTLTEDSF